MGSLQRKQTKAPSRRGLFPLLALAVMMLIYLGWDSWTGWDPAPEPGYRRVSLADLGAFQVEGQQDFAAQGNPKAWPSPTPTVFPRAIKALGGQEVYIRGFMMPYDEDAQGVLSFMLVRSVLICCFGQPPRLNEIVMCQMPKGEHAKFYSNIPVRVYGRLLVGEIREFGQVQALYRLQVEKVQRVSSIDSSMQPLPPGMKLPVSNP
jgi:hypothetical protein